jgi:hypothetical protein
MERHFNNEKQFELSELLQAFLIKALNYDGTGNRNNFEDDEFIYKTAKNTALRIYGHKLNMKSINTCFDEIENIFQVLGSDLKRIRASLNDKHIEVKELAVKAKNTKQLGEILGTSDFKINKEVKMNYIKKDKVFYDEAEKRESRELKEESIRKYFDEYPERIQSFFDEILKRKMES